MKKQCKGKYLRPYTTRAKKKDTRCFTPCFFKNTQQKEHNMNIRRALNADAADIQTVVFEVLIEYGLTPDPQDADKDLAAVEDYYHARNGYFGVVESAGKIIATTGVLQINPQTCELRKMYIFKSHRGKGLGKQLLTFSIEKAKQLGYQRMVLETASPLKEAIALYKKYGFKPYTPQHLIFRCDQAFELILS